METEFSTITEKDTRMLEQKFIDLQKMKILSDNIDKTKFNGVN